MASTLYRLMDGIGGSILGLFKRLFIYHRAILSFFVLLFRPKTWSHPIRTVLGRQILFTGPFSANYCILVGLLVGATVGVQIEMWLRQFGQTQLAATLLVQVILLQLAPLITNVILLIRSGGAIVSEIASMEIHGEMEMLEIQGIDPVAYLLVPRALAMTFCGLGLTLIFATSALLACFFISKLSGHSTQGFVGNIFNAIEPVEYLLLLGKTMVPGFMMAIICFVEGMSVRRLLTELPQAVTRALTYGMGSLFVLHGFFSVVRFIV